MRIRPEAYAGTHPERAVHSTAFGLRLEIDPELEIPGIDDRAENLESSGLDGAIPASNLDAAGAGPPGYAAIPASNLDAHAVDAATPASNLDAHAVDAAATPPSSSPLPPPTRVRLDPPELERRWSPVAHTAEVVRELRDGHAALLTVELARPAGYLLHAPGVGRILVAPDGGELLCDPEPGAAEWATLIPAQALPLAATLRGLEVLHASGVVLDGRAVLFAGAPGAGKSSLAAALLYRGAALLSDDTVALQLRRGALLAHPGVALLHLRAFEHDRLSAGEHAALGPPGAFPHKRRFHPRVSGPTPFGGLCLLERTPHGPPVERLAAIDPFALLASTFNLSVRTPERLVRHLDLAAALAATDRIYRLRVQPGVNATQLADAVRERLPER